ncbi:MAG: energy-coupling factor transporter ATPase, partial [Lachnospiraceae bacterium]|nr:energy-coupling factor transporter ATPase [Lachnospiraceae bacterium]
MDEVPKNYFIIMIEVKDLKHNFILRDAAGEKVGSFTALDGVNLEIKPGQFIAVLGPNGSGKSTFARHLNALLFPDEGEIIVDGVQITENEDVVWKVRSTVGMVFQNPDNQIVAGLVEEDVAFGPENLGLSRDEIEENITKALEDTSISQYRRKNPAHLSGGEKQRVAIAGVLAMRPKCIVLDEATAMLDPIGREKVLSTVHELNKKEGITVITITHYMDEAKDADYIFVMDSGKVAMQGTPDEIFSKPDEIKKHRLDVPREAITLEELLEKKKHDASDCAGEAPILDIKNISYTYNPGHPEEKQALKDVSLSVYKGEKLFILGHTGSGKSTLVQMMNGLLKPDTGSVVS